MAPEEFARRMIMNGNAVEEVENLAAEVENVVVGKVLSVAPHANSDHLHICQVDVGQGEPIQIVTGADNMAAGDFVPVALHDSHLPGGVHIKRGKLRGEVSNGMMCSGEELGVPADVYPSNVEHGLLILREKDLVPGQDIRPVLGLDDAVLNFEILANRPDCLSMLGLAHEAAVVTGGAVQEPACDVAPAGEGTVEDLVDVSVEAPDLCRRYCAAAIRNIYKFGALCRAEGIQLLYHNHDFEFVKLSGQYGLDFLYDAVPADLLATELDTCWVNVAGEDPCAYIRKYAGRCPVVHLKDFVGSKKEGEVLYALIQADGSDDVKVETEKEPAFDFRPVGYGKQNIPAIIAAGLESGASWFIVEQDRSSERPALDAAKMSCDYVRSL